MFRLMVMHPSTLSCLQVFFAILEEGSFSGASRHLNITQSAVSHRLKQLEEITGVTLINRTTRSIKVTAAGERLYKLTRHQLSELERSLSSFTQGSQAPLSVTTISSLATKWLLPAVSRFKRDDKNVPLSILTDDNILDLKREGIDTAIRLTDKADPSLHMTYLCDEWVFPVASTKLVKDNSIINHPERLYDYPWLLDLVTEKGNDESSWKGWLKAQGLDYPLDRGDQGFNRSDITLQASAAAHGIAMARASLVEIDMLDMQLYKQVGRAIKMKYSYYFVCPKDNAEDLVVSSLREWVKAELSQTVQRVKTSLII